MAGNFNLRAIISAVDRLSPALRSMTRNVQGFRRQMRAASAGAVPMGVGFAAALIGPAKAFADLESAGTQLKNTLMGSNGLAPGFEQLNKIAIELGNQLPGTTADFTSMASQLKALGVSTETLTGGALKATAYLAVVGKPLGVTYESAAQAVGKLGNSFGIAANDLMPFTDTLQRTLHMGIDLEQMQFAMARVSGPLKAVGKQGLSVAKDLVPLTAMLIQSGVSGEEAGTGIKKMIEVFAMKGKFKDIPTMVKSLENLNKLAPSEKLKAFKSLFGAEHAGKAAIIAAGGYDQMIKKMAEQANMQQRVNSSLGTLTNLWEAATGSFTNALAAFGESYAPELKQLATLLNEVAGKTMEWFKANKPFIKQTLKLVGVFVGARLGLAGMALAAGAVIPFLNPMTAAFTFLSFAISKVLDNLDSFKWFFTQSPIAESVANFAKGVSELFSAPSNASMRPPSQQSRNSMLTAGKVSGGIDVNFNNAPAGMRVQSQSKGPISVNPNVGYRTIGGTSGAW